MSRRMFCSTSASAATKWAQTGASKTRWERHEIPAWCVHMHIYIYIHGVTYQKELKKKGYDDQWGSHHAGCYIYIYSLSPARMCVWGAGRLYFVFRWWRRACKEIVPTVCIYYIYTRIYIYSLTYISCIYSSLRWRERIGKGAPLLLNQSSRPSRRPSLFFFFFHPFASNRNKDVGRLFKMVPRATRDDDNVAGRSMLIIYNVCGFIFADARQLAANLKIPILGDAGKMFGKVSGGDSQVNRWSWGFRDVCRRVRSKWK